MWDDDVPAGDRTSEVVNQLEQHFLFGAVLAADLDFDRLIHLQSGVTGERDGFATTIEMFSTAVLFAQGAPNEHFYFSRVRLGSFFFFRCWHGIVLSLGREFRMGICRGRRGT